MIIPANVVPCSIGYSGGAILLGVGIMATIGQLLQTEGYRNTSVSVASLMCLFLPVFNLLAGLLFFHERLTFLPESLHPRCWLYANWGVACPACGGFRALQLLCRGKVWAAIDLQPLLVLTVLVAVVYSLYAFGVVFCRLRAFRVAEVTRRDRRIMVGIGFILILLNWGYVL